MQIVQDPTPPLPENPDDVPSRGQDIINRLRFGDLPQMVDWFDPKLLAKVGVRSIISATLGQYTDQRLIQAATDNASEGALRMRYDYSGASPNPDDTIERDPNGAVWIDYIADLGDGFESTYAMAYLLAADELKVDGDDRYLPAGKLLIMGGDQVYPDATKQEYETRLRDPYDWAFSTDHPTRRLFAIPGNHDWYDGLSAFSALFCSARDRISGGIGTQIGGWRCHQHRSYFAIKLPHDWWIWGPDIQLADNLDDSQRDYFDLMADQTRPGDNIILCLAEPSWLHKNYDNLHEISMLARKRGAKICAVLAGDWHHYSRYTSEKLGTQFITSGGGGAFAHATHGLKRNIELKWATPTGADHRIASSEDTIDFNRSEQSVMGPDGPDFTQQQMDISANGATGAAATPSTPGAPDESPIVRRAKAIRKEAIKSAAFLMHAPHIYPPQWLSRVLCLKNLFLPFRNRGFTALVGLVYFLYAWAFIAADPRQSPIMRKLKDSIASEALTVSQTVNYIQDRITELKAKRDTLAGNQSAASKKEALALDGDIRAAEEQLASTNGELDRINERQMSMLDEDEKQQFRNFVSKAKESAEDTDAGPMARIGGIVSALISYSMSDILNSKSLLAASEQSPFLAFLLLGLWAGLVSYVETESRIGKLLIGTMHFAAHLWTLLLVSWIATSTAATAKAISVSWLVYYAGVPETTILGDVVRIGWSLLLTFFVGGALGGFVMGLYWTLTSTLFNMHTGDAFGALGIKNYKHFLRIKLEPGRATVYPIAIDDVPGRFGWRWKLYKDERRPSHNPLIMPVEPLRPRLIEPPIVIEAAKVRP